ncbi:MAG TPA: glyoxalase superfamily protein [Rhodoglobus sp.]|nr:glyoxalase superfamily protein [Rhodoglobus sp.]
MSAIPVLRIVDERAGLRFYVDALGFALDWEHRFEPGLPLYAQVSRGPIVLHLSAHTGDGTPGAVVWIPVADVRALVAEFGEAAGEVAVDDDAPGGPTAVVTDPFGNQLRFAQPA